MGGGSLPDWALDLVRAARVGRFGLIDSRGRPRVLPVTYAFDGESAWSAVDEKPKSRPAGELARIRWLRERPQATLLVDRYSDDWDELAWVQLLGRVTILEGEPVPDDLVSKYPQYGRVPPAGPLLRLDVERAVHWRARGD